MLQLIGMGKITFDNGIEILKYLVSADLIKTALGIQKEDQRSHSKLVSGFCFNIGKKIFSEQNPSSPGSPGTVPF